MCDPAAGDGHYFVSVMGMWVCCKCGAPDPAPPGSGEGMEPLQGREI